MRTARDINDREMCGFTKLVMEWKPTIESQRATILDAAMFLARVEAERRYPRQLNIIRPILDVALAGELRKRVADAGPAADALTAVEVAGAAPGDDAAAEGAALSGPSGQIAQMQ